MHIDVQESAPKSGDILPDRLDCETAALMRQFLTPIFDAAQSWTDLARRLADKGYALGFREGQMVLFNDETGTPVCTGSVLGTPLRQLAGRLGRPNIRLSIDGNSASLHA